MQDRLMEFLASLEPYGYVELTVDGTVGGVGFDPAVLQGSNVGAKRDVKAARVSVVGADVNCKEIGSPAADSGHPEVAGKDFVIIGARSLQNFRAFRAGANNAILRCTLYY